MLPSLISSLVCGILFVSLYTFLCSSKKSDSLETVCLQIKRCFFHSLVSSSEADSWCFSASYTRPQRTAFGNGERIRWLVGESYVRKGKFCPATTTTAMYVTLRLPPPPQDSETGWTWELWSKTNFLNWQNRISIFSIAIFFFNIFRISKKKKISSFFQQQKNQIFGFCPFYYFPFILRFYEFWKTKIQIF